ncbi:MAG TPA: hypothetical protein VMZ91_16825 [Candidatus Paceibacterota bacterium]|nr:hypothetical protein [Candidatus Paceibacterota bacterium]
MAEKKTTNCPCGKEIEVPFVNGEYDTCNIICPECKRHSTGGNFRTGEITSWMTQKDLNRANEEYQRQLFDADCNEWYGRGEW